MTFDPITLICYVYLGIVAMWSVRLFVSNVQMDAELRRLDRRREEILQMLHGKIGGE